MQINRVDNSTNFKMALKVNTKAMPKLRELPTEKLNQIAEFGEKLKDIKFYDVHLNEHLKYEIRSKNPADKHDYLAGFREAQRNCGRHYTITEYDGGGETTRGGYYPDQPRSFILKYGEKAKEEYEKFKQLDPFDQVIQYCKILDDFEIDRITQEETKIAAEKAKQEAEMAAQRAKEEALNNLIDKYGYEEPVVEVAEKETVTKNSRIKEFFKSFWK